jgi:hypothetical protein
MILSCAFHFCVQCGFLGIVLTLGVQGLKSRRLRLLRGAYVKLLGGKVALGACLTAVEQKGRRIRSP